MSALTPELLDRIRSRAAGYDRDNAFFTEDLDELRAAGYLAARTLLETLAISGCSPHTLRRRPSASTCTTSGSGVARVLADRGDTSLDWVLRDAEEGELFAFGNSEPGNDLVLWDSLTTAERSTAVSRSRGRRSSPPSRPPGPGSASSASRPTADGPAARARVPPRDDGTPLRSRRSTTGTPSACARRRATRPCSTTPSCPTPASAGSCRSDRTPTRSCSRSSPTSCCSSGRSTRESPTARSSSASRPRKAHDLKNGGTTYDRPRHPLADRGCRARPRRARSRSRDPGIRRRQARRPRRRLVPDADGREAPRHRDRAPRRRPGDAGRGRGGYRSASELARLQRDVLAGIYHPSDTESVHSTVATNLLGPLVE